MPQKKGQGCYPGSRICCFAQTGVSVVDRRDLTAPAGLLVGFDVERTVD
jgi:hypothetical protein